MYSARHCEVRSNRCVEKLPVTWRAEIASLSLAMTVLLYCLSRMLKQVQHDGNSYYRLQTTDYLLRLTQ